VGGDAIGRACQAEGERAGRLVAELGDLGVDHTGFDVKSAAFRQAVFDDAPREERDEWPLLRLCADAVTAHDGQRDPQRASHVLTRPAGVVVRASA
jgi:hypothetical protein